jgi:predicted metal-dependent hydrolase
MQKAGEIAAARERHLADGNTVLLCGRPYTVRLVCGERCGVIEAGDELIITRPRRYKVEKDEACLYDYLAVQAKEIIDAAFRRIYAAHFENAFPAPCIRFRRVRSYWGMCYHTRGEIVFNTRLVQAPPAAIDYVVMHELVHMLHPDHGPRFYAALSVHMPDYKARIRSLKSVNLRRAPWQ